MFEELGYKKNEDKRVLTYDYIQYFNNFKAYKRIYFYKIEKQIILKSYNLTMQELKAINKKCEELEWI